MEEDVLKLNGVNFSIMDIFLKEGLEKTEGVGLIEES
jgi:hypothetical protein